MGEDSWVSLDCKEIQPVHPKGDQSWVFIGRTDVEAETPLIWPPDVKSWLFEKTLRLGRLRAEGEGYNRGWDDWIGSPTQWTWVWVDSGSWWWTGRPDVLRSCGHEKSDMTERLNWTHASKLVLNIPQVRLQKYMNQEFPGLQAWLRNGRGTRNQMASMYWNIWKAREFQEYIYFFFIYCAKPFDCVDHNKLENS